MRNWMGSTILLPYCANTFSGKVYLARRASVPAYFFEAESSAALKFCRLAAFGRIFFFLDWALVVMGHFSNIYRIGSISIAVKSVGFTGQILARRIHPIIMRVGPISAR